MSKQVTYEQILTTLTEVVKERPDYVYKGDERGPYGNDDVECVYFEDGKPSCIVGHVLARFGLAREDLVVEDGFGRRDLNAGTGVGALIMDNVIDVDEPKKARELLQSVQASQDSGRPWSYALDNGLKAVALHEANRVSEEDV